MPKRRRTRSRFAPYLDRVRTNIDARVIRFQDLKESLSRTGTALPSGSGLGLSIVQAIVKRHGGTIDASNTAAGGARFNMVLPDETAQPQ